VGIKGLSTWLEDLGNRLKEGLLVRSAVARSYLSFTRSARDEWIAREAALVPAGSRVLDVGAGTCPYASLFRHCDYKSQDATRLDPSSLRGHRGYGAIDIVSDITAIPLPSASFDVILCTEVLEHVPEPIAAVREMGRLLAPGGTLLLTAPLGSGLHQEPYHFCGGYTPYWYQEHLPKAGFTDIRIEPIGGFFRSYGQESIRFARFLAPSLRGPRRLLRLVLFPVWLVAAFWFVLICPLLCLALDRIFPYPGFTAGYLVKARRLEP